MVNLADYNWPALVISASIHVISASIFAPKLALVSDFGQLCLVMSAEVICSVVSAQSC